VDPQITKAYLDRNDIAQLLAVSTQSVARNEAKWGLAADKAVLDSALAIRAGIRA
jgi:spore cortex formation protein SpoVR/YcgB (stage V sporulation)